MQLRDSADAAMMAGISGMTSTLTGGFSDGGAFTNNNQPGRTPKDRFGTYGDYKRYSDNYYLPDNLSRKEFKQYTS